MEKLLLGFLLLFMIKSADAQVLKEIKVFYYDDQTVKGKRIYREFTGIGEFQKPENLDIELYFNRTVPSAENDIQVIIEELYEPTELNKKNTGKIASKQWVPHEVIYSGNTNFIRSGKILIKNCHYQTAYYLDNLFYQKDGFRIIGVYHDKKSNKIEKVVKTYLIPGD